MKKLVELLAKNLVDQPEQVEVAEFEEEREVVYELRVAPDDLGKVIGKRGRTARAIRSLLFAAGGKANERFALEIMDD